MGDGGKGDGGDQQGSASPEETSFIPAGTWQTSRNYHAGALTFVLGAIEPYKDLVTTVGAAAISGVIGNAAYDALMSVAWRRWKKAPEQLALLTTNEALTFATAAFRVAAERRPDAVPPVTGGAQAESDGSWRFEVHERFEKWEITLPPGYPRTGRISVKRTSRPIPP
ncbi:hypothetical protein OG792_32775 [Micromonospora sp. NBC_01699]|uniref:hypothetical protein n=1 Tax=Micromonospora sp. NBC_01699 TaxID=2975984 RepID=UPI002E2A8012|nr:hypothetical protein [Micromonospora sp. NBC_01699]